MKNIDCSSSNNDDIKLDKLDLITVDEINAILENRTIVPNKKVEEYDESMRLSLKNNRNK